MGVLDQAARYAAQADPEVVVGRLLRNTDASLRFQWWVDTRTTPRPGQPDRTADRVAELVEDNNPQQPWLLLFEFQAQHDPDKLDVTLVEAAQLRLELRHGEERRGKFKIVVALVYLQGTCPDSVLDMTLSGGWGTKHATLVWNVANDLAGAGLDSLAAGTVTWGILFWLPLMSGADDPVILTRWREQAMRVENVRVRGDLIRIALLFADLAGRLAVWSDAMKEWNMIDSPLVLQWTAEARRDTELATRREDILMTLRARFPEPLSEEIVKVINHQDSVQLLRAWFHAALYSPSLAAFTVVLQE
jgi:hypothetical protein